MANVTNTTCANSLVDLGQQQLEKGSSSEEEGTDVSAQVAPDTWTKRSEEKKQLELDDMKKSPFDHKEPNVAPPFLHDMGSIEDKPNGLPTVVKKGPELWVKAEEILSEESQAWFAQLLSDETQCASRGPTEGPEHHRIIELTKRKQAECEAQNSKLTLKLGNRKLELGKYFGSMIKWLDQFKNIGDMAVAYDPVHAALPWAALRFILQAMVAEQEHMESTLRILATTPRLLFSGRILEAVYLQETTPASEGGRNQVLYQESVRHLQEDLISLYAGILSALEYCYVMFSKKKVHRRIVAIFNSSEPTDIIKELKALETNVTARAEACGRLCSHRLSAHSTNLLQQLDTSLTNINDQMFEVMTRMKAEDKKMILKSISEVPFITHHRTIREERVDGTCGWILEKEEFRKWEDSGTALAILYGSPGSGKTFVISKLIDYTFENAKSEDAVAFFYCSREENSRREPESIFRSLLRQLSSAHDERDLIHRLLQDRAVELVEGTATLSARECSDLIPKMLDDYSSTTIIIDALDECDRVTRHTLMNGLDRLIEQRKRLKIFISSRRDDDIQFHFRFRPIIELKATDNENDLTHFVNSRLSQNEHWKKLSDPLQAMVREKLRHGAGDMFQWAALQLHHLFQLRLWTEQNIEEQLAKFPSDLKGAYDLAWEKIEMMSQYEQKCSKRAFMWILCSAGRLNTRALSMAMLLDPESDTVDDLSSELEEREISGLSENLLVYDKQSDHWRFCHLSAREYFERHHCNTDDANSFVVMGCLKFLLVDPCREEKTACECSKQATSIPSDSTKPFPFPCAALRIHVFEYIKRLEKITTPNDARIELLLKRFLGSPQSSSLAYQDWAQRCGGASRIDNSVLRPFSSPLIAMSVFGVFERLRDWWEESKTNLDLANDQGMQLLDLAKAYHQGDIQEFIVRHIPRGIKPDGRHDGSGPRRSNRSAVAGRPQKSRTVPQRPLVSFLFVVNRLRVDIPERDIYGHNIPPTTAHGYSGETPSKVMRYHNGTVSEATGYQWHRDTAKLPAQGQLLAADACGNWTLDSTGNIWGAEEYKTFSVFACNPLLPIMVVDEDPLAVSNIGSWELLRIFHPRQPDLVGLSQVATPESPMGQGGNPVRYVAGRSPSWIPSLLPRTYSSPNPSGPPSRGLGGELPIILGLMALSLESDDTASVVEEIFLGSNGHRKKWRPNGEWRSFDSPRGYPDTAQDDPRGFLIKVFYDPEHPTTQEMLHWFEWQTAVVRESSN